MAGYRGAKIAIFKAESDKTLDPYVEELEKHGFKPTLVPTITFQYFDLPKLAERLKCPDKYNGLILSSERCVLAVKQAVREDESILEPWRTKTAACAGEATATKTREALGLDPSLGDKHRAEGIIDLLAKMKPAPKLMLRPCGELAASKDTMTSGLAARNIECESVPVYKTEANPALRQILLSVFNDDEQTWPQILIFFSPSGLKSVIDNMENVENLSFCKFVSVGPTTSKAVVESGFNIWAEAETPSPQGLHLAIEKTASEPEKK